ncbi:hypothetical protein EDD80_101425 [Anseongella ginsenosidimutans]|uniref:Uncharacterized protein n=1 Tax=Anseongella ginsenosidimutans TaxID=496056 RepID=A0A4R3KYU4_9SPHI|nr:hypothetical protein [Anseongella ginsenosidimutans]QEC51111.1 hypothetical protein FRZ59_01250 [Anseongella ginsenosidimutans]TCS90226.1 hypothetical protein EDD80_101425 [Anseongella ginsenosidimutans]
MKYFICIVFAWPFAFFALAQDKSVSRVDEHHFSLMNLSGTDALGRRIGTVRETPGPSKYVGVFYSVWLGQHQSQQRAIYDIQQLLNTKPSALDDPRGTPESPLHEFHFWGEPLYGYYSMSDPWVVTRHIELLTNASIDYLCIDATNTVVYDSSTLNLLDALLTFQEQGFSVPRVVFYTNTRSGTTVETLYERFYKSGKYDAIWFKPKGKPMIVGITEANGNASDMTRYQAQNQEGGVYVDFIRPAMKRYFDVRESQWPNGEYNEHSLPWMSWQYPQWNHNGTVAVPVAQHSHSVIAASSMHPECSRGYNHITQKVEQDWTAGANFQTMWDAVFASQKRVDNVLVTSFNEWMAIKYAKDSGDVFFVDVYNHEFSRDIEMMKGGYHDNFYLQLVQNVRKFKYADKAGNVHNGGTPQKARIDIRRDNAGAWQKVRATYADFAGDALPRNFSNAAGTGKYIDQSNRNDITEIKVTHDKENLYFRIKTAAGITPYNGSDLNWMNILIRSHGSKDFEGYQYIVNRRPEAGTVAGPGTTSVERSSGGYNWVNAGEAEYVIKGNLMQVAIPLAALGLSAGDCAIEFKVADNVTEYDDIMDYYVTGDSAPLGRLNFSYGQ